MSNISSKYLDFSKTLRLINKRYKLTDQKQVLVLEAVLSAYDEGSNFAVLDLILMNEIASQATLHGIAKKLITFKLIKTVTCKSDARRKYVIPTKLGLYWLEDCTKALCSYGKK